MRVTDEEIFKECAERLQLVRVLHRQYSTRLHCQELVKPGWMGSTGFIDAGDPPDGPQESPIERFLRRGYRLHVRWRSHEQRFHAYVDTGSIETSHNFMAETMDEALAGLERYLESHAANPHSEQK